jgi:AraC-like DNA-binding protein
MASRPQIQRMAGSGTAMFESTADYQAAILGLAVNLTVTGGGDFKARLSWSTLRSVRVVRGCENVARIAYIALPPGHVCFSFPTSAAAAIWSGRELRAGEIVFRAGGERAHHLTTAESQWGLVLVPLEELSACSKALIGLEVTVPLAGRVLRPSRSVSAALLRLHSKVCRLAETKRELLAHPEVARALEHEMLQVLVNCIMSDSGNPNRNLQPKRRHADIMDRFEDALAGHVGTRLNVPELCAALCIPERTLRVCCAEFVGMSPTRYHLLRRLNSARTALQCSDPERANVAGVARRCGFAELGRFAAAYRAAFGELPSTTWRRARVQKALDAEIA